MSSTDRCRAVTAVPSARSISLPGRAVLRCGLRLASGMLLRVFAGGQQTMAVFMYRWLDLRGEVSHLDRDEERGPGFPGPLSFAWIWYPAAENSTS